MTKFFQKSSVIIALGLSVLIFIACGVEGDQRNRWTTATARGTLAEINGAVVLLNKDEEKIFCEDHFCEPNYVYSIHLGFLFSWFKKSDKKRNEQTPDPSPPPSEPVAQPDTPPPYEPIPEQMDYSRKILEMTEVWSITEGAPEVIVAVIDTGVEVTHPDLQNNIWANELELNGSPNIDDDQNGYVDDVYGWDFVNNRPNAIDDNRHGTHVAGIIAAEKNDVGIIGIAPKVKIMPLKFLDYRGYGPTDGAIKAIEYAMENGANIISNSWGGPNRSELLDKVIQKARNKGILVVAAAGNLAENNDQKPVYPANYEGVISVASTDSADQMSLFSNYGKSTVTLAAPGSNILSTVIPYNWGVLSGTSMAAPQVSGALALALSVDPKIKASSIFKTLCETSTKKHLDFVQCGRMNIKDFIDKIAEK